MVAVAQIANTFGVALQQTLFAVTVALAFDKLDPVIAGAQAITSFTFNEYYEVLILVQKKSHVNDSNRVTESQRDIIRIAILLVEAVFNRNNSA